ncbi:MAG: inositol monophosphatase family protein [Candidatus Aenigmatarchaeota archaeon]
MNWNKIAVDAVKNFFEVMDKEMTKGTRGNPFGRNPKGDIAYELDRVAQKSYEESFPEVTIISEERIIKRDSGYTVFVDPVCGSIFAKRGSAYFATGLTVCDKKLRPVCEAIGLFATRDIYHADRKGAYKNKKKIHVSATKRLHESILNYESYKPKERESIMKTNLFKIAPAMFNSGSVKYSLAWLAAGYTDGFVNCGNLYPTTELIGKFIVERAGGIVSDATGNKIKIYPDFKHRTTLVCSCTKELHKEILKNL